MSAANYSNLSACFFGVAATRGDKLFLAAKRDGVWVKTSWREAAEIVSRLARGLRAQGIEPGTGSRWCRRTGRNGSWPIWRS